MSPRKLKASYVSIPCQRGEHDRCNWAFRRCECVVCSHPQKEEVVENHPYVPSQEYLLGLIQCWALDEYKLLGHEEMERLAARIYKGIEYIASKEKE